MQASTQVETKTNQVDDMQPSNQVETKTNPIDDTQPSKQVETKTDLELSKQTSKQPKVVYTPINFRFARNPCNIPDYNVPMPKLVGPIGTHRFSVDSCMD